MSTRSSTEKAARRRTATCFLAAATHVVVLAPVAPSAVAGASDASRLDRHAIRPASTVARIPAIATAPQARTDMSYTDAAGDATGGAPDVTGVVVANDAAGVLTFTVSLVGAVTTDMYVDLWVDADRNSSTGNPGVEFNLFLDGSDLATYGQRWDGSGWVGWSPLTGRASYQNDVWTVTIGRSDLNGTSNFDFYFISSRYSGTLQVGGDDAPDGDAVYTYRITGAPTPTPPTPPAPPRPAPDLRTYEDASRLPSRIAYTGRSIKHVRVGEKLYRTMKRLGVPRVVAVACWSRADWPSVVESAGFDANPNALSGFWLRAQPRWVHVAPKQCSDVQALMSTRQPNGQRAYALGTVLHERVHAQGVGNEAQTECYAVQLVYEFARELNFVHARALRLEQLAVRKSRALAPRGYWDPGRCRDGGPWDLYPAFKNLTH